MNKQTVEYSMEYHSTTTTKRNIDTDINIAEAQNNYTRQKANQRFLGIGREGGGVDRKATQKDEMKLFGVMYTFIILIVDMVTQM